MASHLSTLLLGVVAVLLFLAAFGVPAPRRVSWFPLAMMFWVIKVMVAGYTT